MPEPTNIQTPPANSTTIKAEGAGAVIPTVADASRNTPPPQGRSDADSMPAADYKGGEEVDFFNPAAKPTTKVEPTVEKAEEGEEVVEETPVIEQEEVSTPEPEQQEEVVQQPTAEKPATQQKPTSDDLTRFDEGTQKLLKRMSTESRSFTIARLDEIAERENRERELQQQLAAAQQGRTIVPPSYYENPNAWRLLPEAQQAEQHLSISQHILQHWRAQLRLVKSGEQWTDLEPINDAQGRFTGQYNYIKKAATGEAEADIMEWLDGASKQLDQADYNYRQLGALHQQKVRQVFNEIRSAEEQVFTNPAWKDTNSLHSKYATSVGQQLKKVGITEANPLFSLFCKTAALKLVEDRVKQDSAAKAEKEKKVVTQQRRAGPTGSATAQQAGGGAKKEVSIDDFKLAMTKGV